MKSFIIFSLSLTAFFHHNAFAQGTFEAERQELRQLLKVIEDGINEKNVSAIEPYIKPGTVVVFQDAVVTKGIEEFSDYFARILGAGDALISDMSVAAAIGAPAEFYGENVAVAFGKLDSTYTLRTGKTINLKTQWTTTVVKQEDTWSIASLHFSNNLFDNPILNTSKRFSWIMAIAGLFLGLLLMWFFKRLTGRPVSQD